MKLSSIYYWILWKENDIYSKNNATVDIGKKMKLLLKRIAKKDKYTIGHLYVDDNYFCDTIEDKDRGLTDNMTVKEIKDKKVYAETAIPKGTYEITLNVVSPKFSKKPFYYNNANKGRVPRLLNVKGFDGVLIHTGNTQEDSFGCIIVGQNKIVGKVINSQTTFIKLYKKLQSATDKIYITIS